MNKINSSWFLKPPLLFQIPRTDFFFTDYSLVRERMSKFQLLLLSCSSQARFSNGWHLCPELTLALPFHSQPSEHYAFLWSALPFAFAVLSGSYSISSLTRWTPPGLDVGASVPRRRHSSVHHSALYCNQPTLDANSTLLYWQNQH